LLGGQFESCLSPSGLSARAHSHNLAFFETLWHLKYQLRTFKSHFGGLMDRLAGLLRHYSLSARVFHSGAFCGQHQYEGPHGYIHLVRRGPISVLSPGHEDLHIAEPSLLFYPRVLQHRFVTSSVDIADLVCAEVDLGASAGNPLAIALPSMLLIPLADLPGLGLGLELLFAEAELDQCGRQAAIDRLCELLLIQLLRYLMDKQTDSIGLLSGLANPKIARAITAIHDAPEMAWSLETLAELAGMSRARFSVAFRETVGVTPGDYLTEWRINVSCTLLKQGRPIAVVANRVGYSSPNALARAFRARMGCAPRNWLAQLCNEKAISTP
jgi:AraC-like DNA-binding protein